MQYQNGKILGAVDLGESSEELNADYPEEATDALVFMANCVNSNFKIPLGYYLIKSLNASQKAKLVEFYLEKLNSINATVVSFTCDGPPTNIAMAKLLGVKYNLMDSSTNFVKHKDVHLLHDPAHMLKLIRNCFKDWKTFYIGEEKICWKYIEMLYYYQEENQIYLANKLTKKHIDCQSRIHFSLMI